MSYTLRPYQQQAVTATVKHFRRTNDSAVIVLPTGSGKSLVISELARLAKKNILVLAHVKELVEQNHAKYQSYGLQASIFSAGLAQKDNRHQVTFGSVQSVAPNLGQFERPYSLLIIDECHRVGMRKPKEETQNQYQQVIDHLRSLNPELKVLGLTATPYRMGIGWIYQYHYHGFSRNDDAVFSDCIFEMPLSLMIKQGFLTKPTLVDAAIAHYDFSALQANLNGDYHHNEVNALLSQYPRVTQAICEQIIERAVTRQGVMIFAATTKHAQEIMGYLQGQSAAMILGDTPNNERDAIIEKFKQRSIKFLVNVAVLTTGFDAPHVDFIAILRPTQSVSLFQQIVGRGLRLSDDKPDCLVIDYAGSGFDLYRPEVGTAKPNSDSVPVSIICPLCQFGNTFWGKTTEDGDIIEHYGRRCKGVETMEDGQRQQCDYRFRFKECSQCGHENDIAARHCNACDHAMIDPDQLLKKALSLKDAMVLRCSGMALSQDSKVITKLKITYFDEDGAQVSEGFNFANRSAKDTFNQQFGKRALQGTQRTIYQSVEQVLSDEHTLSAPDFVIARKQKYFWQVKDKLFDYQGKYRKANQLS